MNEKRAGILLSYVILAANLLIGFIYLPKLLSIIGKEQYGLYQLIGSMIAYMALMDFGLSGTITRYYSKALALKDQRSQENILAASLILYLVLTSAAALLGLALYSQLERIFASRLTMSEIILAKRMWILLLINVCAAIPSNIFLAALQSHERFFFLKSMNLMQTLLKPVIVIAVVSRYPDAFLVVLIQTVINLGIFLMNGWYALFIIKIKIKLHALDSGLFKEMIYFSIYIFIAAFIDQIFWKSNQIILGIIKGTSAVAVYAIATQIIMNYMYLSTAMSNVFLPGITKMVANQAATSELSEVFIRIGRLQYLLLALVLSGFILFGREFIRLWVGDAYLEAYMITVIILIPFTIDLIQNIGLAILKAMNLFAFKSKVFIVIAALNMILSVPLAIFFGGIGCAAAAGFSYFIGNAVFMNVYYHKKIRLNITGFWKEIGNMSIPFVFLLLYGLVI